MPKKVIYNKNSDKRIPNKAIYVGRPSKWGNPFIESKNKRVQGKFIQGDSREEVVKKFNLYAHHKLVNEPHWLDPLKGYPLICWCYPKSCHAMVLWHIANKMPIVKEKFIREQYGYNLFECYNYKIPKGVYTWKFPKYALKWYELRCVKSDIIVYSDVSYTDVMFTHSRFGYKKGYITNSRDVFDIY